MKITLVANIINTFKVGELSTSQKQVVIKLTEKKDKDKKFIKNCRPISLLKVDTKLISKTLAEHLRNVSPSLISSNQRAYVNGRSIRKADV